MKFKTTQRDIRASYAHVIAVPYCDLQTLLDHKSPIAYTTRREGWGADVYDAGGGVAIATGYAPFGDIRPGYAVNRKYEERAQAIRWGKWTKWETMTAQLDSLLSEYVQEVIGNE